MAASSYETNVFINCPFDDGYKPIFDAITFAVFDAGFTARTALEENNTAPERHSKIATLIKECKYGIHDISRVETDPASGLPRPALTWPMSAVYFMVPSYSAISNKNRRKSLSLMQCHFAISER